MTAERPEQVIELFAASLNRGDVDAAITLYESEAAFAPQPGEEVTGWRRSETRSSSSRR